jgi:hypothetical protein
MQLMYEIEREVACTDSLVHLIILKEKKGCRRKFLATAFFELNIILLS